jgi:hypothetical protein
MSFSLISNSFFGLTDATGNTYYQGEKRRIMLGPNMAYGDRGVDRLVPPKVYYIKKESMQPRVTLSL